MVQDLSKFNNLEKLLYEVRIKCTNQTQELTCICAYSNFSDGRKNSPIRSTFEFKNSARNISQGAPK
jgi:hypothetical protein